MAGIYLNNDRIKTSIQNWMNEVSSSGEWGRIDMHIDRIDGFENITRPEWISASFCVLNIISTQIKLIDSFILFLHFFIKDSRKMLHLDKIPLYWLRNNLDVLTPPSLHFTSLEYYNEFYKKELIHCIPSNNILKLIHPSVNLDFFYRTYFDENEELYSREVYVFVKNE